MTPTPRVVAFVHAKGTSERVPRKNLRILGDRPLIAHAIEHARAAAGVDVVVIDSEDGEILEEGERWGATPLQRPKELASNATSGDELAYWQASCFPDAEVVLQAVPTAPFLRSESIARAVEVLCKGAWDSVAAVFAEALYTWTEGRPTYYRDGRIPNSRDLTETIFETTGLYANRCRFVLESRRRLNPEACHLLRVSRLESVDIDSEEDFAFAEQLWRGLQC